MWICPARNYKIKYLNALKLIRNKTVLLLDLTLHDIFNLCRMLAFGFVTVSGQKEFPRYVGANSAEQTGRECWWEIRLLVAVWRRDFQITQFRKYDWLEREEDGRSGKSILVERTAKMGRCRRRELICRDNQSESYGNS